MFVKSEYQEKKIVLNNWRSKSSLKSAFTLVEMLIVVIIVGILSAAILPKLTGYMARTRDLQRHMDLRNIAAAIELYKSNKGKWPEIYDKNNKVISDFAWRVTWLLWIKEYIKSFPKDPSNLFVWEMMHPAHRRSRTKESFLGDGDYLYLSIRDVGSLLEANGALLFARVETPEYANYIKVHSNKVVGPDITSLGGVFYGGNYNPKTWGYPLVPPHVPSKSLLFCTKISKSDKPSMTKNEDGSVDCTYSDTNQLYYIVKVDNK